jgi:hypothetical protein
MAGGERVLFRHTIPLRNWLILLVALVVISLVSIGATGDRWAEIAAIVVPVALAVLAAVLVLSAITNRQTLSELAIDGDSLIVRRWGLFGHADRERFAIGEATDWRPETRMRLYHALVFTRAGALWRLPLYNAQLIDWEGLAEVAPHAVAAHLRRHGRALPIVPGA